MASTHPETTLPATVQINRVAGIPMGVAHLVLHAIVLLVTFLTIGAHDGNVAFMFYGSNGVTDNPGDAIRVDFFLIFALFSLLHCSISGAYGRFLHFWEYARATTKAVLIGGGIHIALQTLLVPTEVVINCIIAWIIYGAALPTAGYLFRRLAFRANLWVVDALIVGSESSNHVLHLNDQHVPVIDVDLVDMMEHDQKAVPHLLIAPDEQDMPKAKALVNALSVNPGSFELTPPFGGLPLQGSTYSFFFGQDLLLIRGRNNLQNPMARTIKRLFDIFGSAALILVLSPLFLALALWIRRDGAPAVFVHNRVGQGQNPFGCYKFRSMVPDAEDILQEILASDPEAKLEWDATQKLKDDPRVTKAGEFLRKTSLDELPQLFNVLKGEMSLVGPRPIVDDEIEKYGEGFGFYKSVRPGITGLWQISGRSDVDYAFRVTLDEWYVRNWSLWADVVVLLRTIPVVFGRGGAY
ncbi:rfbP [Symbiodinium microadriaticum]|nr:rfbP [Symbiodinium microadriaticum]